MRQTNWKRTNGMAWCSLAALLLMAVAEASAQEKGAQSERRLVVSIPDRRLALMEAGRVVRVYPVAVGAAVSPSPSGSFRVVNRVSRPTYYHPGIVIPPGADNPLGTRWIGLDRKGYGIHGTNQPRSIGHAASHGCIRMSRADLEQLFAMVRVGDVVEIHAHPDAELDAIFHPASTLAAQTDVSSAEHNTGGQL